MREKHSQSDIIRRSRACLYPGQYMILPQANRMPSRLPQFVKTQVEVLATPDIGAKFLQVELVLEKGGGTACQLEAVFEHFFYVLEGAVVLTTETESRLSAGSFAYLPPNTRFSLLCLEDARVLWIRHRFIPCGTECPSFVTGHEQDISPSRAQKLLPFETDIAYDMGMVIVNIEPGDGIAQVETHIMQHGLYMLQGQGIYWLNSNFHEVQKNDFIYFAEYCPQYFYVTGNTTGRYLLFKEVNRDYDVKL